MALIKCSECGKEISDKATACPYCGNPNAKASLQAFKNTFKLDKESGKKRTEAFSDGCLKFFVVFLLIMMVIALVFP